MTGLSAVVDFQAEISAMTRFVSSKAKSRIRESEKGPSGGFVDGDHFMVRIE